MKYHSCSLLLIAFLLIISAFYSLHDLWNERPQSAHQWRQTDCTSLTLNYYQNGMNFFQPQIHHRLSGEGYAVGEFPVIYYFVAVLYHIFGVHEGIFRLINLLILFLGLLYLFKSAKLWLKNDFWAFIISLLVFTSPVIIFYGSNFLPNVPALSFALIGFYFFSKYYFQGRSGYFYFSMILFLLAGLLKITAALLFVAIAGLFLFEVLFGINLGLNNQKLFKEKKTALIGFFIVAAGYFVWYGWTHYYNTLHNTNYFFTRTFPIWQIEEPGLKKYIAKRLIGFWSLDLFSPALFVASAAALGWLIIKAKKIFHPLLLITPIILLEIAAYMILFYHQFLHHDYYLINILIIVPLIFISLLYFLKKQSEKIFYSKWIKAVAVIFLIYNIYYAEGRMDIRYGGEVFQGVNEDLHTITPYLRSIGISPKDLVISIPDKSPNASLYLMNQPGWTNLYDQNLNSYDIELRKSWGAGYLIINEKEWLKKEYLQPFLHNPAGKYKGIYIFRL